MIKRRLHTELLQRLKENPAVALLGPRQVGKTTLALEVAHEKYAIYLDLESPEDLAKLSEPLLYLREKLGQLVILDEIHRLPALLPVLRGLIDQARRQGLRSELYLLLGSASLDLLRQSGETLAGRISFLELAPFDVLEAVNRPEYLNLLWVRGGFPESFLAGSDAASLRWRRDFIRTYLERDIPQFGPRIPAETLRRFWTMLAYQQGSQLNTSQLARNLGVDAKTASRYLDLLVDLFLVRRLPVYRTNIGKRLVKSPKVYVRDSGLVHALLGIVDLDALLSHPVVGGSWEGFVVEQLIIMGQEVAEGFYYRTSGGAEIDLVLRFPDGHLWAIEIKRSLNPKPTRGFHSACKDLKPQRCFVVYPGGETYPVAEGVEAVPILHLSMLLEAQRRNWLGLS